MKTGDPAKYLLGSDLAIIILPGVFALEERWKKAFAELKNQLPAYIFEPVTGPLRVVEKNADEKGVLILGVRDENSIPRLENRYREKIQSRLKSLMGRDVGVEFELDLPVGRKPAARALQINEPQSSFSWLNPGLSPERFFPDRSNELALLACENAVKHPGRTNPIFIYGSPGTGKTHLLHLTAHLLLDANPSIRIGYLSIEQFREEFLIAMTMRKNLEFKSRYRSFDFLLIDDLQTLKSSGPALEEEFFYLFNHFYDNSRQLILTADRPVHELMISSRLTSRFLSGLQIKIETPDLEWKKQVLLSRCHELGVELDGAVASAVCLRVSENIREIESIANKLYFLKEKKYNLSSWNEISRHFADQLVPVEMSAFPLEKILELVCRKYSIKREEILGNSRRAEFTFPRHVAMYLAVQYSGYNKSAIARFFKKTDHTTVINAEKNVARRLKKDPSFQLLLESIVEEMRKSRV